MATNATWTVIFDDKKVIKNTGAEAGTSYTIADDAFWSQSKFSNIWAIQHGTSNTSDEVEHNDGSPHSADAGADETAEQKINRLGAKPTSYSS